MKRRKFKKQNYIEFSQSGYMSYANRRSKNDWAGVNPGDAFKANLDYHIRMPGLKQFYKMVNKAQQEVAIAAGITDGYNYEPVIKAQIAPFYTLYPSSLAALASIGLTAFLEYEQVFSQNQLKTQLKEYLDLPNSFKDYDLDENDLNRLADECVNVVHRRLILEDLSRYKNLHAIEMYRLFSASQQTLNFRTVPEIVNAVILYGDVLPRWEEMELHVMTRSIFNDVYNASEMFLEKISNVPSDKLFDFGADWIFEICISISEYLPLKIKKASRYYPLSESFNSPNQKFRFEKKENPTFDGKIPPLDGANPPALFDETNLQEKVKKSLLGEAKGNSPNEQSKVSNSVEEFIKEFSDAVNNAGGQKKDWEDMRSDIVEEAIRKTVFSQSPIQGSPASGHELNVDLGGSKFGQGEVFDRPVEMSNDLRAYEILMQDSDPIAKEMKKALYPNIEKIPEIDKICSSGIIDSAKLPYADFSLAIFKRYRMRDKADKRGRPVLLIACDGSGSLGANQMKMLKTLACAWLTSTAKSSIQVLAGLYHSGNIRTGLSAPLIQWMYHPRKISSFSKKDASRTIVSLPQSGTGYQTDALQIAFMLDEAITIAQGRMVYLILITDCCWNISFNLGLTGQQEVYSLLEKYYENFKGKLHTTLVGLGVSNNTGFEDLVDKVIKINSEDLTNYMEVAGQIGKYVASTMRERTKLISK